MIWTAAALLAIGALLIALAPLASRGGVPSTVAAIRARKASLADELAELSRRKGAGEINDEEFAAQRQTLETEAVSLLEAEKTAEQKTPVETADRRRVRVLSAAIAFLLAGNIAAGVYLWKGGLLSMHAQGQMGGGEEGGPPMGANGAPDVNAMVARLEARLKENPEDLQGLAMLGRSYMVMERFEDAAKAYSKAASIDPNDLSYQIGYGVATLRTGNTAAAEQTFTKVLAKEPNNVDALWFTGMLQVHKKDSAGAQKTWKKLLDVTPDEQKAEMQQQIDRMQEMLNQGQ